MSDDQDLQKLIELARSAEEPAKPLTEQELFIRAMKITAATDHKIPAVVIYWYYKKWKAKRKETKLISRNNFFKGWHQKFRRTHKSKRLESRMFYWVKSPYINPTKEELRLIDMELRDERVRQKRALEWRRKKKLERKLKRETKQNIQD